MFGIFGRPMFYAGVQAELKAQFADQAFVNRVCQTDAAVNLINEEMFPNRKSLPCPKAMRYFLVVCEVLAQRLAKADVGFEDQVICAKLLQDRYNKVMSDPVTLSFFPRRMTEWRERIEDFAASDEFKKLTAGAESGSSTI